MLWKRLGHLLLARRVPQNQDVRVSSAFPQRSPTELPQPKIAFNERKAYRLRVEISTFEYNRCTSNLAAGLEGATVELQMATTKNAEVPTSAASSSKVLAILVIPSSAAVKQCSGWGPEVTRGNERSAHGKAKI